MNWIWFDTIDGVVWVNMNQVKRFAKHIDSTIEFLSSERGDFRLYFESDEVREEAWHKLTSFCRRSNNG